MVEFANWIQDPRYTTWHIAINARVAGYMVHSCPQQRFQASLAILVGSRNGKRIDHLVTYPADNLRAAANVQPGYLADLILVNGNPLDDITILQDHDKLHYIMKDGRFHAEPGDHDAPPPDQHELLSTSTDAIAQQRP